MRREQVAVLPVALPSKSCSLQLDVLPKWFKARCARCRKTPVRSTDRH